MWTLIRKAQPSIWMRLSTNNSESHQVTPPSRPAGRSPGHQLTAGVVVTGVLVTFLSFVFLLGATPKPSSKVYVKKLKNSRYQLMVNKKPYIVKGVCYNPIPIGYNHEYDWWSDSNTPCIVDGKLMKEMGPYLIREYRRKQASKR